MCVCDRDRSAHADHSVICEYDGGGGGGGNMSSRGMSVASTATATASLAAAAEQKQQLLASFGRAAGGHVDSVDGRASASRIARTPAAAATETPPLAHILSTLTGELGPRVENAVRLVENVSADLLVDMAHTRFEELRVRLDEQLAMHFDAPSTSANASVCGITIALSRFTYSTRL